MKRGLFIMAALFFTMSMNAQTADRLHTEQGVKANFKDTYSRELNYLAELWNRNVPKLQVGDWPNELDYVSDCGTEADLKSSRIISVSNITANTAKAVEELRIDCDGTVTVEKVNLDLVLENGKWVIDDYFGQKQKAKNILKKRGINPELLTDLISFVDILKTNGNLSKLEQTHGFKSVSYGEGRNSIEYVYKNCVIRDDNVVPYGQGTSVIIVRSYNMAGEWTTIQVFNDRAFYQLETDVNSLSEKYENGTYVLKWSNGNRISVETNHTNNGKGGTISIFEEWH